MALLGLELMVAKEFESRSVPNFTLPSIAIDVRQDLKEVVRVKDSHGYCISIKDCLIDLAHDKNESQAYHVYRKEEDAPACLKV